MEDPRKRFSHQIMSKDEMIEMSIPTFKKSRNVNFSTYSMQCVLLLYCTTCTQD